MRVLLVFCHPDPTSFTAAVRDAALARLADHGAEVRVLDLYAEGFSPALSREEWTGYLDAPTNRAGREGHCDDLAWCDALLFVYPTWWYGLPAVLKGWLDRVMLPAVAFHMPDREGGTIRPGLGHVRALGVLTTCGASRLLTWWVGSPGRRTILRGLGLLCAFRHRSVFLAHYLMDSSTPESRARHLARVPAAIDRLAGGRPRPSPRSVPA